MRRKLFWGKNKLAFCLFLILLMATAKLNYSETNLYDFKYTILNGEATITGYPDNPMNEVRTLIIPTTVENGIPVTAIADYAFQDDFNVIGLVIPDTVKTIGQGAFRNSIIIDITLPQGLTKIEPAVFYGNFLLESINIPQSVTEIGFANFESCVNLKQIQFNGDAPFIPFPEYVFLRVPMSAKVYYPMGANGFGATWQGFETTPFLQVRYDSNDATIGTAPIDVHAYFSGDQITLASQNDLHRIGYEFIGWNTSPDGNGINYSPNTTITFENDHITLYANWVPRSHLIEFNTNGGTPIDSLEMPHDGYLTEPPPPIKDGYTFWGWYTDYGTFAQKFDFEHTRIQTQQVLHALWTKNGYYFYDRFVFKIENNNAIITDYIKPAGHFVIPGTLSYNNIEYPVTEIQENAFFNENYLDSVTFPSSLKVIGHFSFSSCIYLKSLYFAEGLEVIGNAAFDNNQNLLSLNFPKTLKSIGSNSFNNCKKLTSIQLNEGIMTMGPRSFAGCIELESISLPGSLTSVGSAAFEYCIKLSDVTIGEGIQSIDLSAFEECLSLTTLEIPASVKQISHYAFRDCTNLKTLFFSGNAPEAFSDIFDRTPLDLQVHYISTQMGFSELWQGRMTIPHHKMTYYGDTQTTGEAPLDDKLYLNAEDVTILSQNTLAKENCLFFSWNTEPDGSGMTFLPGDTLSNTLKSYNFYAIWIPDRYTLTFISNGGTDVASQTIAYQNVAIVPIEPTKKYFLFDGWYLDDETFQNRFDFENSPITKEFTLYAKWILDPEKVYNGFAYDLNFNEAIIMDYFGTSPMITVPGTVINSNGAYTVTQIGDRAFENDTFIQQVTLPESIRIIGYNAFANCNQLSSINLPTSLLKIRGLAFSGCSQLSNLSLPENLIELGSFAFLNCTNLTSLVIPSKVGFLGVYAFQNCENLSDLTLWCSSSNVDFRAFQGLPLSTVPKYRFGLDGYTFAKFGRFFEPFYFVTYLGNGNTSGSEPSDLTLYLEGDSAVIQTQGTLSNGAMLFKEWNSQPDGLGISYLPNTTATIHSQDLILYAIWKKSTPPTITLKGNADLYLTLGTEYQEMGAIAFDEEEGDLTAKIETSGLVDSSQIGTYHIVYSCTDSSMNTVEAIRTIHVIYDFSGFFKPIATPPSINMLKAGSQIKLKFSLNGDYGLNILELGYPVIQGTPINNYRITYDAITDEYSMIIKTDKTFSGINSQLQIKFNDGKTYFLLINFK